MQLGSILDGGVEFHAVGREVKFHILRQPIGGRQDKGLAEAVLYFVDEQSRHEADRHADEALREDPLYKKHGLIPADKRREEEYYAFLVRALRNKDNPAEPFCPLQDYQKFRRAVVSDVVTHLLREYKRFVRDEYPEILTAEQAAEIAEEAAGK